MDGAAQQVEKYPDTEIPKDNFALYDCTFTPMQKEEIVKQGMGFYWDKGGRMGFEIDGNIIHPEPVITGEYNPRYVVAVSPSDKDSEIHGGMGFVRKMRDTKTGRIVAAKQADFSKNAIVEARKLAAFAHPNVVTVYDIAVTNPKDPRYRVVYFISEWLVGNTLQAWNKKTHTINELASVVDQIAAGVHHINSLGYVYGDLKPLNIMFDHFGIVKLIDAGVSYKITEDGTARGHGIVTPNYAPREQNDGILSVRSDEYSLAAVIFEMLVESRGINAVIDRRNFMASQSNLIPFNTVYGDRLSAKQKHEFSKILRKALQENPAARYTSVKELNDRIQKLLKPLI